MCNGETAKHTTNAHSVGTHIGDKSKTFYLFFKKQMTRHQQLANFMEAIATQERLDSLRSKRKEIRAKYLSAPISQSGQILNAWKKINEQIAQTSSDLFLILA